MDRQWITFGVVLALVAMLSFSAWPLWQWLSIKNANAALQARAQALVEQHAELKPAWKIALLDGVLTWDEAKEIVEGAGEKLDPQP